MGTAYGITGVLFSVSLLIFPLIIGTLRQKTGAFTWPMIIFAIINALGMLTNITFLFLDYRAGNILRKPVKDIAVINDLSSTNNDNNKEKNNDKDNYEEEKMPLIGIQPPRYIQPSSSPKVPRNF